jgi:hypothetical protein
MCDIALTKIFSRELYIDTANRTYLYPACIFRTIDDCDMHGGWVSPRALQIPLCGDVEHGATGALSPFAVAVWIGSGRLSRLSVDLAVSITGKMSDSMTRDT